MFLVKKETMCLERDMIGKMSKKDCRKYCAEKGYQFFSSLKIHYCYARNKCTCHCGYAGCQIVPDYSEDLYEITNGMYFSSCFSSLGDQITTNFSITKILTVYVKGLELFLLDRTPLGNSLFLVVGPSKYWIAWLVGRK